MALGPRQVQAGLLRVFFTVVSDSHSAALQRSGPSLTVVTVQLYASCLNTCFIGVSVQFPVSGYYAFHIERGCRAAFSCSRDLGIFGKRSSNTPALGGDRAVVLFNLLLDTNEGCRLSAHSESEIPIASARCVSELRALLVHPACLRLGGEGFPNPFILLFSGPWRLLGCT